MVSYKNANAQQDDQQQPGEEEEINFDEQPEF